MDHWFYEESHSYHTLETKEWYPSQLHQAKLSVEIEKGTGTVAFYTRCNSAYSRVTSMDVELPLEVSLEMTAWLTEGLYNGNFDT